MLKITDLMSEDVCYQKVRSLRWGSGPVSCPRCYHDQCDETGCSKKHPECKSYCCQGCGRCFNDLTGTIFSESNLSLTTWMACLYLMNMNASNRQISQELEVSEKTAQRMTTEIRKEVRKNSPSPVLSGEVEFDEVYVVAGHKGHPKSVKKKGEKGEGGVSKVLEVEAP